MITTESFSLIRKQRRQKQGAGLSGYLRFLFFSQTTPESNSPEKKVVQHLYPDPGISCIQTLLFQTQISTVETLY